MCSIPISFYKWMILTCNILKLKEKIRYLPMKSYVIMTEISAERFFGNFENQKSNVCILCEQATHILW